MKDLKIAINEFLTQFHSEEKESFLRNAIMLNIKDNKIALNTVEIVQNKLNEWFEKRLYAYNKIIGEFKTISNKADYGYLLGIGYDVTTQKDTEEKINLGRFLTHLLLLIESREREIKYLKNEIQSAKETYLDMENVIRDILIDKNISKEIKDKFSEFYWLNENWENEE